MPRKQTFTEVEQNIKLYFKKIVQIVLKEVKKKSLKKVKVTQKRTQKSKFTQKRGQKSNFTKKATSKICSKK